MGAESAEGDDDGEDEVGGGRGGWVLVGWVERFVVRCGGGGRCMHCGGWLPHPAHPLPPTATPVWLPCRSTERGGGGMDGSSGQQPAAAVPPLRAMPVRFV